MVDKTSLSTLFNALESGEVTLDQVALALGVTVHGLRIRISKWGLRLPLLLGVLDKLAQYKISRDDAAAALGVKPHNVNSLERSWRVRKPLRTNIVRLTSIKIKWQIQHKYALDFISGAMTLEEAAEMSNLSTRSVRRKVDALLDKHKKMTYKELAKMHSTKRSRIADDIEFAERLDHTTQATLESIVMGDKTITEEAVERIVKRRERRTYRKPRDVIQGPTH